MEKFDTESLKSKLPEVAEHYLGKGERVGHNVTKYLCPFHAEKTPSFYIYEDHWWCYGSCGKGGDVIDLVQHLFRMNFLDACKFLGAEISSPEVVDQLRQERKAKIEAEEQAQAALREEYFTKGQWKTYHDQLDAPSRTQWRTWGIPDSWQDNWMLGYTPSRGYQVGEEIKHCSAHTMPMWTFKNGRPPHVLTTQYRLHDQVPGAGRFRFEKGLGTAPFICRSDWKVGETEQPVGARREVLVVEGPRKAATTYLLGTNLLLQVVGIPSKNDTGGILEALKAYDWVYVWLDPDVRVRPVNASDKWEPPDIRLCRTVGIEKSSYIRCPIKIDDALLAGHLDQRSLAIALRGSNRVSVK